MKVEKSVVKAIAEAMAGDNESAMLHACNAVDGTACKIFPNLQNGPRFKRLLRDNYNVLGPMGAPGINLVDSRFPAPTVKVTAPYLHPDTADIIYAIHRCSHGHGDELPLGFELVPDAFDTPEITRMVVTPEAVRLSDRMIFALLAVAVLHPINSSLRSTGDYFLTFGASQRFPINEWWGRNTDFLDAISTTKLPLVIFNPANP